MASEVIKLNLIPKGEMPVFHASQFDTGRLITCELYRGEDAYSVPSGYTVELHCRKVDNNIVTMASTLINDNVVTFTSTEQLTACNGKNLCEVAILDEGYRIGTLNFILEVEVDPLKGGITSTSEIHNLESQIEEITTEIVGENYYNKTEVDDLLDAKADASSVYTKSETDTKLALKANAADVYTKSQTDTLLNTKADSSSVYTKGQVDTALAEKASITYVDGEISAVDAVLVDMQTDIDRKADSSDVYTKAETDAKIKDAIEEILPVDTAGPSAIASFTTGLALPLVDCKVGITATGGNGTPDNPNPITGYSSANITANGITHTIAFGQTVYGGQLDVTRGKLHVTHLYKAYDGTEAWYISGASGGEYRMSLAEVLDNVKYPTTNDEVLSCICNMFEEKTANQTYARNQGISYQSGNGLRIYANDYNTSDITPWKTLLTNTPLQVVYELATPFDIDLTPEVISAIVGENTVFSDTGNIEVKYKTTIQDYIDSHTGG